MLNDVWSGITLKNGGNIIVLHTLGYSNGMSGFYFDSYMHSFISYRNIYTAVLMLDTFLHHRDGARGGGGSWGSADPP